MQAARTSRRGDRRSGVDGCSGWRLRGGGCLCGGQAWRQAWGLESVWVPEWQRAWAQESAWVLEWVSAQALTALGWVSEQAW